MKRKVIGMLIVMIIGSLFSFSAIAMTRSEFNAKLDSLRQTYYHGKQQSTYEEGSTCFGYAYMIAKSVFGTSARTWATAYDLNNVKPGDVVQYGNTTGNGHTIFVTNVSGDTITYTDCNSDYEATIKWNQTVLKSSGKIWSYAFSYRKVAPNLESDKPKDTEPPKISDVTFQRTPDGYIVSCRATDNISIKRVLFPTWTAQNGQDDLDTQWDAENSSFEGTRNGDYYTYRVRMSDHNNEEGIYYTHIYAYDSYGNNTSSSITINVYKDTEAPVIKNVKVSEKDGSGYTVTCDVSDNKKIEKVQFPTWTAQGGQDDLNGDWDTSSKYSGTIQNNKVTFRVNIADHNYEDGIYKTHIYAYDECGNTSTATQLVLVNHNGYSPLSELQYNGHKYAFFDNSYNLDWSELKQYCELLGGYLACITSSAENDVLAGEASRLGLDDYFIGGSDAEKEGSWKWVTGEPWSYTKWESGEPNNLNDEDYLAITKQGNWNDLSLGHQAGFICEFENAVQSTKSTVKRTNNTLLVTPVFYNVTYGNVLIVGYLDNRVVSFTSSLYTPDFKSVTLTGNPDLVKVMVWDQKNMKPITTAEVIPPIQWN